MTSGSIANCTANSGGGLSISDGTLSVSNVTFTDCTATLNGGGICKYGDGSSSQDGASTVRISDLSVIISGNTSTKNTGAGICIWQGKLELSGSAKIADKIYLYNDKQYVTIAGELSQPFVANILLGGGISVTGSRKVLDSADMLLVRANLSRFNLTNSDWKIGQDGCAKKK